MTGRPNSGDVAAAPADVDYEEIEAAVLESERGRWFLSEFARRNRNADTERLLAAIHKLESHVASQTAPLIAAPSGEINGIRSAICEMADEIAQAKREIAAISPPEDNENDIADATAELDAIVVATENATSDILSAAEQIQEIAWTLRELEAPVDYCDALDERATEIYTACSFQDITGQRTSKVVRVLQLLEARLNAMAKLWSDVTPQPDERKPEASDDDKALLNGPAPEGEGVDQDSIDRMMSEMDEIDAIDDVGHAHEAEADEDAAIEDAVDDDAAGASEAEEVIDIETFGDEIDIIDSSADDQDSDWDPADDLPDSEPKATADDDPSATSPEEPGEETPTSAKLADLKAKDYEALFS